MKWSGKTLLNHQECQRKPSRTRQAVLMEIGGSVPIMVKNTPEFGSYIKGQREGRSWTQDNVTQSGGPERHLLGKIEAGADIDLTLAQLRSLDQAFDFRAGNCRALIDFSPIEVTPEAAARGAKAPFAPICGFADDGRPVGLPNNTLSMLPTSAVVSILEQHRHLVLVDIRAAYDAPHELLKLAGRWANSGGRVFSTTKAIGVRAHSEVQQVVIDPIPLVSTLQAARDFVEMLQYGGRRVKSHRDFDQDTATAATLVWICSIVALHRRTGEHEEGTSDGLSALSTLAARHDGLSLARPSWLASSSSFLRQADLSNAAAKADPKAVKYVAGLLRARDELTELTIEEGAVTEDAVLKVNRQAPPTVTVTALFEQPTIVFYDSWVSPELPGIVNWAHHNSFEVGGPAILTLQQRGAHRTSDAAVGDGAPHGVTIEVSELQRSDEERDGALRDVSIPPLDISDILTGWHESSRTAVLTQIDPEILIRIGLPGHVEG